MEIKSTYFPVLPFYGEKKPGVSTSTLFVLTKDDEGLFACYVGIAELPAEADGPTYHEARQKVAEKIAFGGQKLSFEQASGWFQISRSQYRK